VEAALKPNPELESSNVILERLARAVATKPTTPGPMKPQSSAKKTSNLMMKSVVLAKPINIAKAAVVDTKKFQNATKKVAAVITPKKIVPTMATVAKPVTIAKQALSAIKKVKPIQTQNIFANPIAANKPNVPSVVAIEVAPSSNAGPNAPQEASKSLIEVYGQFLDPNVAQELNLKNASSLQSVLKALPSAVGKHHSDINQAELNRAVDMIVGPGGFSLQDLPSLIDAYRQSGLRSAVNVEGISAAQVSIEDFKETLKSAGINLNNK
jgi:hypothetical protein